MIDIADDASVVSVSPSFREGHAGEGAGCAADLPGSLHRREDPGFGGLVRVRNKRQEFVWVHEQFEGEY